MTPIEGFVYLYKSVEEFQQLSNWFHAVVGIMIFAVAVSLYLSLIKSKQKVFEIAIPVLLIIINSFLILYGFLQHGIQNFFLSVYVIFTFPEFYVHTIMAIITIVGSIFELLYLLKRSTNRLFLFALPFAFTLVGILFILHPHAGMHDMNVMIIHSVFGFLLIFAGFMMNKKRITKNKSHAAIYTFLAAIALTVFALLLVQFREPSSAYQFYFSSS